jgi:uncharacterized protein YutE (UPF0331/DUF86 family)
MIQKALVCSKLAQLRERQQLLEQLAAESREAFLADPIRRGATERALQVSIEVCLDIGQHLIAALGLRRPAAFREVFAILGQAAVISADFAARLEQMAGFRNRLVHGYATIDPQQVYAFLQNDRRDFDEFAQAIAVFVRRLAVDGEDTD